MFPSDGWGFWFNDTAMRPDSNPQGLFIVGCIVYKDQFGIRRETRFCHSYADVNTIKFPAFLYQCPYGENTAR